MKIVIKDANVLIDLEVAELFDLWFQLGHETMTTDLIVAELRKGRHLRALEYIRAGHIRVESCSPDFLAESFALMQEIGDGPSFEDCTVLLLAMQRDAMLLSGDKPHLFSNPVQHGVDSHTRYGLAPFMRLRTANVLPTKIDEALRRSKAEMASTNRYRLFSSPNRPLV